MYICNIARLWQQKVEIMRRTVKMRCFRKKSLKTKPLCWLAIFPALSYIWLRQLDTESCADSNIDTILLQAHSPVMFFYSLYTHKVTLLHYFLLYSPVQGLSVLSRQCTNSILLKVLNTTLRKMSVVLTSKNNSLSLNFT